LRQKRSEVTSDRAGTHDENPHDFLCARDFEARKTLYLVPSPARALRQKLKSGSWQGKKRQWISLRPDSMKFLMVWHGASAEIKHQLRRISEGIYEIYGYAGANSFGFCRMR
jgi:hypothetical protein